VKAQTHAAGTPTRTELMPVSVASAALIVTLPRLSMPRCPRNVARRYCLFF